FDLGLLGLEGGEFGAAQDGALRHLGADRIDPLAALPDLVVQVRAGRRAGRADIGDHLALAHLLPGLPTLGVARQVGVAGLPAAIVAEPDPVAVTAPAARLDRHPVAGGIDRRAGSGAEVDALVHAAIAVDRVPAHAEPGGHPRPVDGGAQQEAFDVLTGLVEVVDLAAGPLEPVE